MTGKRWATTAGTTNASTTASAHDRKVAVVDRYFGHEDELNDKLFRIYGCDLGAWDAVWQVGNQDINGNAYTERIPPKI